MGSSFENRVQSIVNESMNEQLELFQDSIDRTGDLLPSIEKLVKALPLIQDIKTEVASIEKILHNRPDKDENEDEPEEDTRREPMDPQLEQDVIKLLEDLTNNLVTPEDIRRLLPETMPPALPGTGRSIPKNEFNWIPILVWVSRKMKELTDKINDGIAEHLTRNKIDYIYTTLGNIYNFSEIAYKAITKDIKDRADELSDKVDDINDALSECCDSTSQGLQQLQQDVTNIKNKVNQLSPQADENKDLALQSRTKALLSEIQSLRGLL